MDYINQIILGNALYELPKLPAESVNCCICSPPYWSLRDYGIEPVIWDGDKDCKHEWGLPIAGAGKNNDKTAGKIQRANKGSIGRDNGPDSNFCIKCGAWKGSLGLEPTFELYIKHLCDIFDEVKRVLRKDGTCWVNMGDSYGGSGNRSGHTLETSNLNRLTIGYGATGGNQKATRGYEKSLLDIPYRFSIEMINRGWIKRNTLIWHKPNCMPSSANDRFTIDFEYLFFFTKNNKAIFWTNEKTLECVDKKPLGVKGIEGKDWEWRLIGENYENYNTKISREDAEKYNSLKARKYRNKGMKKVSLWTGHDYWFEQQFEESIDPESYTGRRKRNAGTMAKHDKKNYLMAGSIQKDGTLKYGQKYPNRNKRAVWIIPTQPFPEAHFAVYPEGLIEIPIKAGCPEFICKKCGKARVKIYEYQGGTIGKSWHDHSKDLEEGMHQSLGGLDKQGDKPYQRVDVGYSDCGCGAGWESGIVLDPFMGAGTTAKVAIKQRKRFTGIEIKKEYIEMSKRGIAKVQRNLF